MNLIQHTKNTSKAATQNRGCVCMHSAKVCMCMR